MNTFKPGLLMAVLLTLLSSGCDQNAGLTQHPSRVALMVVGDSISAGYGIDPEQGWVRLLEAEWRANGVLRDDQTVLNASVSGATSADGLRNNEKRVRDERPAILVIELGGNDGLRRLPPNELAANLTRLALAGADAGSVVVLAGVDFPGKLAFLPSGRYRAALEKAAADSGAILVPDILNDLSGDELQADGVHPSAGGQPDIVSALRGPLADAVRQAGGA